MLYSSINDSVKPAEQTGSGPRVGKRVRKEQERQRALPAEVKSLSLTYQLSLSWRTEEAATLGGSGSLLLEPIPSPVLSECKLLKDQYYLGTHWSPGLANGTPCSALQQAEADCSTEPWLLPELIKEGSRTQACSWIIQEDRWAPEQTNSSIIKWPWAQALHHLERGHSRLCVPYTWILKRLKRNI